MIDINKIKDSRLFVDLTIDELEKVAGISKVKEYNNDENVIREHMEGKELYVILEGEVRVTKTFQSGEKVTFATLKRGNFFGALSFLTQKPHSATVTAISKTQVMVIEKNDFDEFIEKNPKTGFKILKKIIYELSELLGQMNINFTAMMGYMWRS